MLMAILAITFSNCSKDTPSTTVVEVRLIDSPGDYQEVNIDIQGVEINSSTSSSDGWKAVPITAGIYNLLKLTNGLDMLLGKLELPSGKLSQVRLILGANNSVKIADQSILLSTPSAQQSGLKLQVNADLVAGVTYKLLLDFDAARSIVSTGNGKYILKPVIKTVAEALTGAIKGIVLPVDANPAIYAIIGTDTVSTTFPDVTGSFLLSGLNAKIYKITFQPKSGYLSTQKENVSVTIGNVTNIGTVTIIK